MGPGTGTRTTKKALSVLPTPHAGTRTLEQCEQAVHLGMLMAGEALREIRERRLYTAHYGSGGFETYCRETFHYTRQYVNRLIRAFGFYEEYKKPLGAMGPNLGERHYQEFLKLKTKAHRTAAIIEVQRRFGDKPLARQVQEVVDEFFGERRVKKPAFVGQKEQTYEAQMEEANESFFMKIKHLDEDLERIIENYSEYHDMRTICQHIIETAARLQQETREEPEGSEHQEDQEDA